MGNQCDTRTQVGGMSACFLMTLSRLFGLNFGAKSYILLFSSCEERRFRFSISSGLIPRSSAAQQTNTEQSEVCFLIPCSLLRGYSLWCIRHCSGMYRRQETALLTEMCLRPVRMP